MKNLKEIMEAKILHKYKPTELRITQVGKRIIVQTLEDLKNKKQ